MLTNTDMKLHYFLDLVSQNYSFKVATCLIDLEKKKNTLL